MNLGNSLFRARKKSGLSQEEVAEKLGISRQTVSKWETGDTLPDIRQSKRLALLYHLSLDELIDFDLDVQEIEQAIARSDEKRDEKIDWTRAWGKKYPILLEYPAQVNTEYYAVRLDELLQTCGTSTTTASWTPCWSSRTFWPRCGSGGKTNHERK